MFNLFKKAKYRDISSYEENWSIFKNEDGDNSYLIRINTGYKAAIGHPEFPVKLGIAISVESHDEKIKDFKHSVEEFLYFFYKDKKAVLTAIIIGLGSNKFIEFLSYTGPDFNFAELDKNLQEKYPDFIFQLNAETEQKWNTYKSFL